MGVDWYSCSNCGQSFPDCGYYFTCSKCEHLFCSDKCGAKHLIEEGEPGYSEKDINWYGHCTTCVLCRKESATDNQLLHALLEHFKITYEQAMEIYRKQD